MHFLDMWILLIWTCQHGQWTVLSMICKDDDTDMFQNSQNSVKVKSRKRNCHLAVGSHYIVIKNSIDCRWRKNNMNLDMQNALL